MMKMMKMIELFMVWQRDKKGNIKRLEAMHGLLEDRDRGYVPPCGGSPLRNYPNLHKVKRWLSLTGWPLAVVIYLLS